MSRKSTSVPVRWAAAVKPHEGRAVILAFLCNFVLLGSYYILRPLRDTTIYRFGDLTAAWMQTAVEALGFGIVALAIIGGGISAAWGGVAIALGRRFERMRSGIDNVSIGQPVPTGILH